MVWTVAGERVGVEGESMGYEDTYGASIYREEGALVLALLVVWSARATVPKPLHAQLRENVVKTVS